MRLHQKKKMLIQKCQLKFNSFVNSKNKKSKINNNSKDCVLNLKNKPKKNLKNHKKTFTSNYLENNLLKKNNLKKNKKIIKVEI